MAWHVLLALSRRLGRPDPPSPDEGFPASNETPELLFVLQLTPELAETVAEFDRVCFIDAHTGSVPGEIHQAVVKGEFQNSPFTHHMTPATCLALSVMLYNQQPEALLVSVRGYEFGFSHSLSARTAALAEEAAEKIWQWCYSPAAQ